MLDFYTWYPADGKSERGDHPVVRMPLRQWMLAITKYADRLLTDLDGVDWDAGIKALQRAWIGRSEVRQIVHRLRMAQGAAGRFLHHIALGHAVGLMSISSSYLASLLHIHSTLVHSVVGCTAGCRHQVSAGGRRWQQPFTRCAAGGVHHPPRHGVQFSALVLLSSVLTDHPEGLCLWCCCQHADGSS